MPNFVSFFFRFSRSRRLETANWLCLIICNRKIRNSYSFKLSVFSSIECICRRANIQLYRILAPTLGRELKNTPHTLLICGSACLTMYATVWTEMFLHHSIRISLSLERLNQSSPFFMFFHNCKGKFMTYLKIDIICSRFFLFLN